MNELLDMIMEFICFLLLHPWLAFPAVYFFFSTVFLNRIDDEGLLFPHHPYKQDFIYFTSDIFDVFWLIVGAVPNALFAGSFFLKTWDSLSGNTVGQVLTSCSILIVAIAIWFGFIAPATKDFNEHKVVWSHNLSGCALWIYKGFGLVSATVLSSEGVCTISYIICFSVDFIDKAVGTLSAYALIAAIIMLLYWVMLVLSNISNRKISKGKAGEPGIFPKYYGFLGSVALLVVTICTYLFWKVPPSLRPNFTPIISSIVLPGIAIVLQIIQIKPADRKEKKHLTSIQRKNKSIKIKKK